jgi:LuxR family transcriptional regulator, maltose regulon positive regulatory protein
MPSMSGRDRKNIVLLRTKLSVPPLHQRLVPSAALTERLQQGAGGKLTLISAPPGFGKTTLVCQWIQQYRPSVAWYSLDANDNEPSVFYRYLLVSLQDLDPSLKSAFDPLLQRHTEVGTTTIATIINHISYLSGSYHLVLDDFHEINSPSLLSDISYLLHHSPPQLHVTIITRHDPPFQLSRLRARQELLELKMGDLQFSLDEAAEFFSTTMGLSLTRLQIQELHALTQGWPVGLQVLGLTLRKGSHPKRLTIDGLASNKYMMDYLFEEVFSTQSAEAQEFLLKTSILKQLNAELCSHVIGAGRTRELLDELEHKNLFLIPLDDELQWYRYHPLFAQMLAHRLEATGLYSIPELHKRASDWYAEHGYLEEAFQHGLRSGDLDFAAGLAEAKLMALVDDYEWAIARRWLESLPEESLRERFLLLVYRALVILLQEEFSDITTILAELEESFDEMTSAYPPDKKKHAADLLSALKLTCLHYKEPAEVIPAAEEALRTISPRDTIARWGVQSVLSTAHIEHGDLQPALEVVRAGLSVLGHSDPGRSRYVKVHLLNRQARLEFLLGHLRAAEGLLAEAFEYARGADPPVRSAMAMFNITFAQIYYAKNQLDLALEHAERCCEYARPVSDIGYLLLGLKMQAFVNQSFGRVDFARGTMHEALRIARQTRSSVRIASAELAAVQLAVMQSELDTVSRWAAQRQLSMTEPFSRSFEKECLLMAAYHMTAGRFEEAQELLRALRPRVAERQRLTSLVTLDALAAACLNALGQGEEGSRVLEACIEFAGPEGYVRPFVENAAYLLDLFLGLRKSPKGVVRIHAAELLKACRSNLSSGSIARPVVSGDAEALSQREIEILRMIFVGLSNKEISTQSFISANTVKTHIRSIYTKLGVTAREQAILRARELNYM